MYELQLRRKLLQQQLGVVDERCQRVAKAVAKKHLARLSRQEKVGQPGVPDRDGAGRKKVINNPGGLPSMGVVGMGSGVGLHEPCVRLPDQRRMTTEKSTFRGRGSLQQKQDLMTAAPFKKGGCIDHTRKKQMLQNKQREIERQSALEKKMRPAKRGLGVRDEVAAAPSAFPDRYLRGEVPCSKHCSAGTRAFRTRPTANIGCFSEVHKVAARTAIVAVCTYSRRLIAEASRSGRVQCLDVDTGQVTDEQPTRKWKCSRCAFVPTAYLGELFAITLLLLRGISHRERFKHASILDIHSP